MARWESRTFFVYIMGSKFGVLYIGVTNNLERRVKEHREGLIPGFTKKYRVRRLLYFEQFERAAEAIAREKQIKGWKRARKLDLIHTMNLEMADLGARRSTRDSSLRSE
ncbi:MAG: GIY-YIG nuclease family protein [Candidatus Binatus sp.]|uniref:GIY-YIG nuclease family protein n=1 Tax=Candidatus Binatus sp. TaxID=2811406 RepID=UPI003C7140FF